MSTKRTNTNKRKANISVGRSLTHFRLLRSSRLNIFCLSLLLYMSRESPSFSKHHVRMAICISHWLLSHILQTDIKRCFWVILLWVLQLITEGMSGRHNTVGVLDLKKFSEVWLLCIRTLKKRLLNLSVDCRSRPIFFSIFTSFCFCTLDLWKSKMWLTSQSHFSQFLLQNHNVAELSHYLSPWNQVLYLCGFLLL